MKRTFFFMVAVCSLISACSGIERDYVVRERVPEKTPVWMEPSRAHESDSEENAGKFRYYVNEADNVNRDLCKRTAEVTASAHIAAEIAQEILANYEKEISSKGTDAEQTSTAKLKDIVRQDIQTKLHGVQIQASSYERRAYLEERGARKNRESYHCAAVAKISLKNLQELLEAYKSETTAELEHKTETLKLERRRKEALVNAIDRTSEGLSAAVGSM